MHFDLTNISLLGFNNKSHVTNHLNYLFRTDGAQKWTNEHTNDDLLIVGDDIYTIGENLDDRKAVVKKVREFIGDLGVDYKHLYMCRIECPDNNVYFFNNALLDEAMDIIKDLDKELKMRNKKIMFAVTHEDQTKEYLHFHLFIYDWG